MGIIIIIRFPYVLDVGSFQTCYTWSYLKGGYEYSRCINRMISVIVDLDFIAEGAEREREKGRVHKQDDPRNPCLWTFSSFMHQVSYRICPSYVATVVYQSIHV